jgi:hypothetical protein
MMGTYTETTTMITEHCCNCGIIFAIAQGHHAELLRSHAWFYCPAGHSQHYTSKSDAELLKAEQRAHASTQEELRIARIEADAAAKKAAAELKRTRKKAIATQCLNCHRTISPSQMARHIATKHPTLVA